MYYAVSGQNNVRGEKYVVVNRRMMSNVISRPQYDVVSNRNERLDGVVFQDEAVLSNAVCEDGRF